VNADRALWLLAHPLEYAGEDLAPYREILPQPDGALLTVILAVDR
jgi:hypothetical protein